MRRWLGLAAACVAPLCVGTAGAQAKSFGGIIRDVGSRSTVAAPRVVHAANLPYGGGPVLHSNRTHVIFWEPAASGLGFEPGYQSLVEQFLRRVAGDSHRTSNVYGLTGQYGDSAGAAAYASSYGGAVVATDRLPANGCVEPPITGPGWTVCLTDSQLQAEIGHVVRADRLSTGSGDVYFLVTPRGLGSCTDASSTSCALGGSVNGYCGYHSQSSNGQVLYAVIPYNAVPRHCQSGNPRPNASAADPVLSTVSHEHSEVVTDPSGNAWIDSSGNENGDLCITSFGPAIGGTGATAWNEEIHGGHYFLQEEWSNADNGCQPRTASDSVAFTARLVPGPAWTASFSAHASDPHGTIIGYRWFYGDGQSGQGQTASHRYRRRGHYRVVLRTTDSWHNWAYYSATVAAVSAKRG